VACLAAVAFLVFLVCERWLHRGVFALAPRSTYLHRPAEGCPAGTTPVDDLFRMKGELLPGCFDPQGDGSVDLLRPNEGLRLRPGQEVLMPDGSVEIRKAPK
jgi:hypothetical protein